MSNEQLIRMFAGSFILIGLLLSHFVHYYFIGLVYFVGLNLLQSSFTKFCPLEKILIKFRGPST
ncbi:MAG: DUF2892 domain-containing protein [Halobacteriovoraceae bacterium]|nr:DUF2892 domain-containing protein [Halobacteriovoraceae bacterium]